MSIGDCDVESATEFFDNSYIFNNTFVNMSYTVILMPYYGDGNEFYNNNFTDNITYSIFAFGADTDNNKIYNNFFNTTGRGATASYPTNMFNTTRQVGERIYSDGAEIGGNFWANPSGTGFSQTCADSNKDGFCDSNYTDATNVDDKLPLSTKYVADNLGPHWSQNQTNNSDPKPNDEIIFSVFWNDTQNNGSLANLSGYMYSWHNGTNWTQTNLSVDLETGEQTFNGSESSEDTFEDWEDFEVGEINWTDQAGDSSGCDWTRDNLGTGSSNTGPCSGSSSCGSPAGANGTNYYDYVETSSGFCDGLNEEAWLITDLPIDFDSLGNNARIIFNYNMYGSNMGNLSLQENTTGSWAILWSKQGDQGTSWYDVVIDLSSLSGYGHIRFNYHRTTTGYLGDVTVDQINITGTTGSGMPDYDTNKSAVNYANVISGNLYSQIDNITVTVYVSYYNNTGSATAGNNNPDIFLEVYNGAGWTTPAGFSVSASGNNYSILVTDSSVLSAWETTSNRDIRLYAGYMDYNTSEAFDTINWTEVWVNISSEQEFLNDSFVAFNDSHCVTNFSRSKEH